VNQSMNEKTLFTDYAIDHIEWPDSEDELDRFLDNATPLIRLGPGGEYVRDYYLEDFDNDEPSGSETGVQVTQSWPVRSINHNGADDRADRSPLLGAQATGAWPARFFRKIGRLWHEIIRGMKNA